MFATSEALKNFVELFFLLRINSFKIFYRPNKRFISALNLYFGKGRKIIKNGEVIYTPRPWYEVEISTIKEEREHKDYPKGSWDAYVEDDGKYYRVHLFLNLN